MRTVELKIKIKSLAKEAQIIREEERRRLALTSDRKKYMELREHRVGKVRSAARYAQLAYGFLRGKPYRTIEAKCHKGNEPFAKLLESEIVRFGEAFANEELYDAIRNWLKGSKNEIYPRSLFDAA